MDLLKQTDIDETKKSIRKLIKKNLIPSDKMTVCLASKSPRRRDCLKSVIPHFKTDSINEKEEPIFFSDMKDIALYLALWKLKIFLQTKIENRDRFIITSDTIVYYEEGKKLLGKPENINQAEQMLRYHFGRQHTVASAVVIADRYLGKIYSIVDTADVRFRPFIEKLESVLQQYLELNPPQGPLDKAGAYGIQEKWIKKYFIEGVIGDEYTVIGFPLIRFKKLWTKLMIQ